MRAPFVMLSLLALGACGDAAGPDPTAPWPVATPASQGMNATLVEAARAHIRNDLPNVNGVLVVRNGYTVFEDYFGGTRTTTANLTRSVTKSVVSAVAGIALAQGWIDSLEQPLAELLPEYYTGDEDPRARNIRMHHLFTMSSGLNFDAEVVVTPTSPANWAQAMVQGPMWSEPGVFRYDSSNPHLVSAVITHETGFSVADIADELLFGPMGIATPRWDDDPQGISNGSTGLYLTVRDMAKIGYLYLRDGVWEGTRLLPEGWVAQSTKQDLALDAQSGYAFLWWTDQSLGVNLYYAAGFRGQYIFVVPSLDLVVAIASESLDLRGPEKDHSHLMSQYFVPAATN